MFFSQQREFKVEKLEALISKRKRSKKLLPFPRLSDFRLLDIRQVVGNQSKI